MQTKSKGMSKKKEMTKQDASRIQSHADKTGEDLDFKARAQKAADKKE
ncbi:MAG: hypothetical protein JSV43_02770 [Methanobacteriota archaeon]|nr:MAG: hypothetical protein JSV43_02770 [Euryarchaeota archaeon]